VTAGPHDARGVLEAGQNLEEARGAVILVHGRGASAGDILGVVAAVDPGGVAYLAPQATGNTWYPWSFLEPLERNEPWLSSGLNLLSDLVDHAAAVGIPHGRIALLGFSQGACLALEFAARNARRYGALVGLSGGLIGPEGTPRDYPGSFDGTPVFLGCSDVDPHVPKERVEETAEVLERLGANVETRLYPGMGHTINPNELEAAATLLRSVAAPTS
jgi:glyoxalase family protein